MVEEVLNGRRVSCWCMMGEAVGVVGGVGGGAPFRVGGGGEEDGGSGGGVEEEGGDGFSVVGRMWPSASNAGRVRGVVVVAGV